MASRRPVAGLAVAGMMLASLLGASGLLPGEPWLPGLLAWLAGLLLLADLNRFQRVQSGLMFAVGAAGLAWAASLGDFSWRSAVSGGNHALLAMLSAVTFLRLITGTGPLDGPLPRGRRAVLQTLAATHLFGAVINISAPVMVGERVAQHGRLSTLQGRVISRAFVAASMWSPFFIAMALILQYLPHARFTVIAGGGFLASFLLLAWCAWRLPRAADAERFVGYPLRWQALWAPSLLSGFVLGGHLLLPQLPILPLIQGAALGVVGLVLPWQRGWQAGAALLSHARERLPGMAGEFAMFLASSVMSAGIDAAVRHSGLSLAPATLHAGGASALMAGLLLLTLVGIHPVATLGVLAGAWPLRQYDGDLLGIVFLLVWGLGLVASPFSGTSFVFQARFGARPLDLLRWNGAYVVGGYLLGVAMLYAYEGWVRGVLG